MAADALLGILAALLREDMDAFRTLLHQQQAINHPFRAGMTLLHIACLLANQQAVNLLLAHGANVYQTDEDGNLPRAYLDEQQSPLIVRALKAQEAKKLANLFKAIRGNDLVELANLIKQKVPAHLPNGNGYCPLHLAAFAGFDELIDYLLQQHPALANQIDPNRRTPLMYAARSGFLGCVEVLLKHEASVHAVDKNGKTALHFACYNGHQAVADRLLKAGADAELADQDGATPLLLSRKIGNFDLSPLRWHKVQIQLSSAVDLL